MDLLATVITVHLHNVDGGRMWQFFYGLICEKTKAIQVNLAVCSNVPPNRCEPASLGAGYYEWKVDVQAQDFLCNMTFYVICNISVHFAIVMVGTRDSGFRICTNVPLTREARNICDVKQQRKVGSRCPAKQTLHVSRCCAMTTVVMVGQ